MYSASVIALFWSKVDRSGGPDSCWPWLFGVDRDGYGRFSYGNSRVRSHRFALTLKLGRPIRKGYQSCHDCPDGDNPACQNPAHLWEGTQAQNIADMQKKGRHGSSRRVDWAGWSRGANHHNAKVTPTLVKRIRREYASGKYTQRRLAEYYELRESMVFDIVHFRCWGHVV